MKKTAKNQLSEGKLETGLLQALKAIDNQVARELQRTPAEREAHGVQKWQAYADRVESVSEYILISLGQNKFDIDGLIVLSQALTKSLNMLVQEMGSEGLGQVRSEYLLKTFAKIEQDAFKGKSELSFQENNYN